MSNANRSHHRGLQRLTMLIAQSGQGGSSIGIVDYSQQELLTVEII
jgi:hypothetical protein